MGMTTHIEEEHTSNVKKQYRAWEAKGSEVILAH
jgi:hypothetical protein